MRKALLVGLLLAAVLSVGAFAGKIAIVWDSVGRGDLSFNDACYAGVVRAVADFGYDGVVDIASPSTSDFVPNLRLMARRDDVDLIIGNGYMITEAIGQVAAEFPNKKFVNIDGYVPNASNVRGYLCKEGDGAAVIGALMALQALDKGYTKVGNIYGIEGPVLYHFEAGFRIGVDWALSKYQQVKALATKPNLTFDMVYSGSWFDPALGKQLAQAQIAEGVVGIFNVSGGTGIGEMQGIAEAHANAGTTSGPPYYFGVDQDNDWRNMGQFCPMSMLKRVDLEAYDAVKVLHDGTFKGGRILEGVAEGIVYVSTEADLIATIDGQISTGAIAASDKDTILANWRTNRATFADWIWTALEDLKAAIASGSVIIPFTETVPGIEAIRADYPLK